MNTARQYYMRNDETHRNAYVGYDARCCVKSNGLSRNRLVYSTNFLVEESLHLYHWTQLTLLTLLLWEMSVSPAVTAVHVRTAMAACPANFVDSSRAFKALATSPIIELPLVNMDQI